MAWFLERLTGLPEWVRYVMAIALTAVIVTGIVLALWALRELLMSIYPGLSPRCSC